MCRAGRPSSSASSANCSIRIVRAPSSAAFTSGTPGLSPCSVVNAGFEVLRRLGLGIQRMIGQQRRRQHVEPGFARDLRLGAALRLVGQIQIFQALLGVGLEEDHEVEHINITILPPSAPALAEAVVRRLLSYDTQVTGCRPQRVAAGARRWEAERIWVCAGDELQTLFGPELQRLGLIRCKLQMMRSEPIDSRLGPMVAAGLALPTIRASRTAPASLLSRHRSKRSFPITSGSAFGDGFARWHR